MVWCVCGALGSLAALLHKQEVRGLAAAGGVRCGRMPDKEKAPAMRRGGSAGMQMERLVCCGCAYVCACKHPERSRHCRRIRVLKETGRAQVAVEGMAGEGHSERGLGGQGGLGVKGGCWNLWLCRKEMMT